MTRIVKVFIGVLLALIIVLPALLLVGLIVLVSVIAAGTTMVGALGVALPLLLAALLGVPLVCAGLLLGLWFMRFHHATLHVTANGVKRVLKVRIDLSGRQVLRQLYNETVIAHQHGAHWWPAFDEAVDGFFHDELRDYLLHQVSEQYGLDVATVMSLADDQSYHFSL
ncbi:hypothetical protein ACFQ3L_09625 [Lacticaseibacillus jixianensis]|uniref:Uncharacterized protein n=1 Tax=Lacticaseibacillus jixianensis TaxID=2486012 RepID=A0ABW4BBW6_9LACO|nr:hypothetical protein [Lacticaseibacillus jixianensis]